VEDDEESGTESESGLESMVAEAKEEACEKGADEMYAEVKKEGPSAVALFHTRVRSLHWTSIRSVATCSSMPSRSSQGEHDEEGECAVLLHESSGEDNNA
jgi:hypothetical protein